MLEAMHESMKDASMEELLAYFARRRPGYAERAEGASAEEVASFERLAGRPLPPDYALFLRAAGRNSGDMFEGEYRSHSADGSSRAHPLRYDFRLETALKERRRLKGLLERNPKLARKTYYDPGFVRIGNQSHSQDGGDYYLDLRKPDASPVVNLEDSGELRVIATSFREFLFLYAFSGKRF